MTTTRSGRIARFEQAVVTDPAGAVDVLRQDLKAAGGPLIERADDGADDTVLVTFVWIGSDGPVSVHAPLFDRWPLSVPLVRVADTDVWHVSVVARADISGVYHYLLDDPSLRFDRAWVAENQHEAVELLEQAVAERSFADPFNPDRLPHPMVDDRSQSVLTLPSAEPLPWFDGPPAAPGALHERQFASTAMANERTVTVYTPPGFTRHGETYPVVVMLDGQAWVGPASQHVAFDHLIAAGRIPPVVVAFVHNPDSGRDQGLRRAFEMCCNPDHPRMLADELLPMLREHYHVSTDPRRVVIAGPSFGGLASAYAGLQRPEVFGNVLACSPAVWWGYSTDQERFSLDEHGYLLSLTGTREEPEWLIRQYAAADRLPLRFWVDVGCLEVAPMMGVPAAGLDYRAAVRHFRTVLIAKGYDVTYYESPGGHDWPTFRRSYVKGLQTLLAPVELP